MNIEKLAIEHASHKGYCESKLYQVTFSIEQLEAFAKALQSSEPVAECGIYMGDADDQHGIFAYKPFNGSPLASGQTKLFTHPPASVPLEKYNKLEQQLAELTDAYLLMRTGLNCLSDKAITGNQADILLGSEIPDFINYKERMRDIGSWEKLLTLAKGDWVKQAIAEAEGKEG